MYAPRTADCDSALSRLKGCAPQAAAYLDKYAKSEYTLSYSNLSDNRVTSQLAEGSMAADLHNKARHTLPYSMFRNTVMAIEKQHRAGAVAATSLVRPTPPKVESELHWLVERASQYSCTVHRTARPLVVLVRRLDGTGGDRRVTFDTPPQKPPSCCERSVLELRFSFVGLRMACGRNAIAEQRFGRRRCRSDAAFGDAFVWNVKFWLCKRPGWAAARPKSGARDLGRATEIGVECARRQWVYRVLSVEED